MEKNITHIKKSYLDSENNIITELVLNKINIDTNIPEIIIEFTSYKYNAVGSPLSKGELISKTINFNPIGVKKARAVNSTVVDSVTGEIYGELNKKRSKVRNILTKEVIGDYNEKEKIFSKYSEESNDLEGSPSVIYEFEKEVEGEANFLINAVYGGASISTLIISMFDRIVNQDLV